MKIRVSEIFGGLDPNGVAPVIQGEGLYAGKPSIFVRLFGCNLRCPGFGISDYQRGQVNKEVESVIEHISTFTSINELPLISTGCDSYFSVYPEFKRFVKEYSPEELVSEIISRRPPKTFGQHDVIFTGGEPLLNQKALALVLPLLEENKQKRITFETNGTMELKPSLLEIMNGTEIEYLFSVSPKLSNSGHGFSETFVPEALRSYNKVYKSKVVLKFVISLDSFDEDNLFAFIKGYFSEGIDLENIFLMPEGGNNDIRFFENSIFTSELCCKYGFSFSSRLQVSLFDNQTGT